MWGRGSDGKLQGVLGTLLLSVVGVEKAKNADSFSAFLFALQMLHLGMHVLMLNCGRQQIQAGDLTQGGLLSFLLYQEDLGRYVQVSQEPGHTLFSPIFLSGEP